jgi:DNA-directed RNA polymerase specialized sigma24 family protein
MTTLSPNELTRLLFGGLSVEETAEVLKISPGIVKRGWSLAQARLYRQ